MKMFYEDIFSPTYPSANIFQDTLILCSVREKPNQIADQPNVSISLWLGLSEWTNRCESALKDFFLLQSH